MIQSKIITTIRNNLKFYIDKSFTTSLLSNEFSIEAIPSGKM